MASINVATSHLLALVLVLALGMSQLAHAQITLAPCSAGMYSSVSPAPTALKSYLVNSLLECRNVTLHNEVAF